MLRRIPNLRAFGPSRSKKKKGMRSVLVFPLPVLPRFPPLHLLPVFLVLLRPSPLHLLPLLPTRFIIPLRLLLSSLARSCGADRRVRSACRFSVVWRWTRRRAWYMASRHPTQRRPVRARIWPHYGPYLAESLFGSARLQLIPAHTWPNMVDSHQCRPEFGQVGPCRAISLHVGTRPLNMLVSSPEFVCAPFPDDDRPSCPHSQLPRQGSRARGANEGPTPSLERRSFPRDGWGFRLVGWPVS